MRDLYPFLIIGVVQGSVIALASLGLVLTYNTSGILNFGHGALAMTSVYIFYSLRSATSTPIAILVTLLVVCPLMGVCIDRVLLRTIRGGSSAPTAAYVVASLGLLVALQAGVVAIYGGSNRPIEPFLPTGSFAIAGVRVGTDQLVMVIVALGVAGLLTLFLQRSKAGLQMRAVVVNRDLAEMCGTDTRLMSSLSWAIGTSLAGLAGILLAPTVGLDSVLLSLLVVQAFGAAVLGGLKSLAWTTASAYAVGILVAFATKIAVANRSLAGLPTALPFLVLFGALLVGGKKRYAGIGEERRAASGAPGVKGGGPRVSGGEIRRALVGLSVVGGIAVGLSGFLSGSHLLTASATAAYVLVFGSLALLVSVSRQISLCHAAFVALGATTAGHLMSAGAPWWLAIIGAGFLAVPLGAVLAVPAIRLSGLMLALATFGFGVLMQYLLFNSVYMFGILGQVSLPRPHLLAGDRAFYLFAVGVAVLGLFATEVLKGSRFGRILRALGDSELAVESLGISATTARVLAFSVSAFVAAVAGSILGLMIQQVNAAGFLFLQSLIWIAVLAISGGATVAGVILASMLFTLSRTVISSAELGEWVPVAFGVGAIVLAGTPNGLSGVFGDLSRSIGRAARGRLGQGKSADTGDVHEVSEVTGRSTTGAPAKDAASAVARKGGGG